MGLASADNSGRAVDDSLDIARRIDNVYMNVPSPTFNRDIHGRVSNLKSLNPQKVGRTRKLRLIKLDAPTWSIDG